MDALTSSLALLSLPLLSGCVYLCRRHIDWSRAFDAYSSSCSRLSFLHPREFTGSIQTHTITRPDIFARLLLFSPHISSKGPRRRRIARLTGLPRKSAEVAWMAPILELSIIPSLRQRLAPGRLGVASCRAQQRAYEQEVASCLNQLERSGKALRLSELVGRSIFRGSCASLLGPSFDASVSHLYGDFDLLVSTTRDSKRGGSLRARWFPQATDVDEARDRLLHAITTYLLQEWYADSDGDSRIDGINPLVQSVISVVKQEELGVDEAAGIILVLLCETTSKVSVVATRLVGYILSGREEVREALVKEIRENVYGQATPRLDSALQETLRLVASQPSGASIDDRMGWSWSVERDVKEDATIEVDQGEVLQLSAGMRVVLDVKETMLDVDLYPSPTTFDAERFLDGNVPLPATFGHGNHACPGMQLANSQIKGVVSEIFRSYTLIEDDRVLSRSPRVYDPLIRLMKI